MQLGLCIGAKRYLKKWYEGDMIIGGVWYQRMVNHRSINISSRLLTNSSLAFVYSHPIIASKFPMLPCATRKGGSSFSMVPKVRENLIVAIEDK
jgi:hypothetical protein